MTMTTTTMKVGKVVMVVEGSIVRLVIIVISCWVFGLLNKGKQCLIYWA